MSMKKAPPRTSRRAPSRRRTKKVSLFHRMRRFLLYRGVVVILLLGVFSFLYPATAKQLFVDTFFFFSTSDTSDDTSTTSSQNYTVITTGGTSFDGRTIVYKGFSASIQSVGTYRLSPSDLTGDGSGNVGTPSVPDAPILEKTYLESIVELPPVIDFSALKDASGAVKIPVDLSLSLGGEGMGIKVVFPAGLTISADNWTGDVAVSSEVAIPPGLDVQSGKVVAVDFGGAQGKPVGLSSAAVVAIPYEGFASIARPAVKVTDMADVVFSVLPCTTRQYTGGPRSDGKSYSFSAYTVAGAQHCYAYDIKNVYIATNHFSTFVAGVGATPSSSPAPSSAPSGGGGGGGGSSGGSSSPAPTSPVRPLQPVQPIPKVYPPAEIPPSWYQDIPFGHWARNVVVQALSEKIFNVKSWEYAQTGRFNPDTILNRAQMATITVRMLRLPLRNSLKNPFFDVRKTDWFSSYVYTLKLYNFFPRTTKFFRPSSRITRGDFLHMLVSLIEPDIQNFKPRASVVFKDVSKRDVRYKAIAYAVQNGLISGYSDRSIGVNKPLALSELLTILSRVRSRMEQGVISRSIPWALPWHLYVLTNES